MTNSIGLHKFLCQQANQVVILLNITLVQNINSAAIDLNSDLMKIVIGFFNGKWNFILILKAKRRPILSGFFRVACRIPIQILLSYYHFWRQGQYLAVTRPANSRMQVTFPDGVQGGTLNPLVEVKPYEALKTAKIPIFK